MSMEFNQNKRVSIKHAVILSYKMPWKVLMGQFSHMDKQGPVKHLQWLETTKIHNGKELFQEVLIML